MSWLPTRLPLMYVRHHDLAAAMDALHATGVPLIGFTGSTPYPAGCPGDSPGLYYYVPLLARATGLSLEPAVLLFLGGTLALAVAIGVGCWWAYARSWPWRVVGTAALLLVCAWSLRIGDTYTLSMAIPIAAIPALLLLWRRAARARFWLITLALLGIAAGIAGLVRPEAGVVAPAFAVTLILLTRMPVARRALFVATLAAGMALPWLGMLRAEHRRDEYLARAIPGYVAPMSVHPLWHNVYLGLGYLDNVYGLHYSDALAFGRVAEVSPGTPICTPAYDAVLRREVVRLFLRDPGFIGVTVMAKAGATVFFLLVFANIGLIAAWRTRKPRPVERAFALALLVGALPGLLVAPGPRYLEGFEAVALLYGLVSLEWALPGRRARVDGAGEPGRAPAAPEPGLAHEPERRPA